MSLTSAVHVQAQMPLSNAFAHNDYAHERPLLEALENGFNYVEADVWLIGGELYVYHDRPAKPDPSRTLLNLYVKPLLARMKANEGRIFNGYDWPFYLMIDIKSEGVITYRALYDLVSEHKALFHTVVYDAFPDRSPVRVFVSGNRPVEEVLRGPVSWIGLDGRPGDLGKDIGSDRMPVVSDNYWKFSAWRGVGEMKEEYKSKIRKFVDEAHLEGKKVRLWGHPDTEKVWKQLLELGVDLINTDRLAEYRQFVLNE